MPTFELIPPRTDQESRKPSGNDGIGSAVLLHNARWFTRIRWIVVFVLLAAGIACVLAPGIIRNIGINPPTRWPWVMAGALVLANTFFCVLVNRLTERSPRGRVEANIWLQIIIDLVMVTFLVHLVGSRDTFISLAYVFHIVLACIFFPPARSLLVTLFAASLFLACVALEMNAIWPATSILAEPMSAYSDKSPLSAVFAGSAVCAWLVVWHLVSTLSEAVRKRDRQLSDANSRLVEADQEKNRQVLRTVHDLKAPFAGIESNIHVLRLEHWDKVPESVRTIVERIDTRAQALRERIRDIVTLGELRSRRIPENERETVDLKSVMDAVLEEVEEKATARGISLNVQAPSVAALGTMKDFVILFSNLLANAIFYSHEHGKVDVAVRESANEIAVRVADHGIGIDEESLPHIFDEYFRTKEGAQFNKLSTGLGLSLVREIAASLRLRLIVTSEQGKGTTFEVFIPRAK